MQDVNTEIPCIRLRNVYVIPVKCPRPSLFRKHDVEFASRPLTMATDIMSSSYVIIANPLGSNGRK